MLASVRSRVMKHAQKITLPPARYQSAADLQAAIEAQLPDDLRGRIDVYVLDVSSANDIPA